MNSVKNALVRELRSVFGNVRTTTGADTAHARPNLGIAKTHWTDAACMTGAKRVDFACQRPHRIVLTSRGTRQAVAADRYGFPRKRRAGQRANAKGSKRIAGIVRGDRAQSIAKRKGARVLLGTVVSFKADGRAVVETKTGERFSVQAHRLRRRHHTLGANVR